MIFDCSSFELPSSKKIIHIFWYKRFGLFCFVYLLVEGSIYWLKVLIWLYKTLSNYQHEQRKYFISEKAACIILSTAEQEKGT